MTSGDWSIVELMIAMVLASLLTIGLFQIFTSNNLTFRMTESIARTQEAGRIATEILSREIRGAGYFGCNKENVVNNLDETDEAYSADAHAYDIDAPISSRVADRPGRRGRRYPFYEIFRAGKRRSRSQHSGARNIGFH